MDIEQELIKFMEIYNYSLANTCYVRAYTTNLNVILSISDFVYVKYDFVGSC